jgi:hypothetical protein
VDTRSAAPPAAAQALAAGVGFSVMARSVVIFRRLGDAG